MVTPQPPGAPGHRRRTAAGRSRPQQSNAGCHPHRLHTITWRGRTPGLIGYLRAHALCGLCGCGGGWNTDRKESCSSVEGELLQRGHCGSIAYDRRDVGMRRRVRAPPWPSHGHHRQSRYAHRASSYLPMLASRQRPATIIATGWCNADQVFEEM